MPEVAAALLWSLPASGGSAMPYLYVAFLAVLLLDRVYRDDARCAAKYGKAWKQKKCFRFYRDSNIRGLCPLGSLALYALREGSCWRAFRSDVQMRACIRKDPMY